jgi:hypothetical protein
MSVLRFRVSVQVWIDEERRFSESLQYSLQITRAMPYTGTFGRSHNDDRDQTNRFSRSFCYKMGKSVVSNIELEWMKDFSVYHRYVTAPILSDAITLNGLPSESSFSKEVNREPHKSTWKLANSQVEDAS